jgi:hypothetical protein
MMHAALVVLLSTFEAALPATQSPDTTFTPQVLVSSENEPERRESRESLRPPGNLPFSYEIYTFRGEAGTTAVVAAYAVAANRLKREDREDGVQFRMVVSLVLADTAIKSVTRTDDSVTVRMRRKPPRDQPLRLHAETRAPPTSSTLQRVILSDVARPGYGQLYDGPFPVPDYSGSDLMLSDLALADPGVEDGWRRGEVTLALLPAGRLPRGKFDLYYEIYNLPAGSPYSTEITIERVDAPAPVLGVGNEVGARFVVVATEATDGTVLELRRIESPLEPGQYRLKVTVRDQASGRTAQRSRLFQIGE